MMVLDVSGMKTDDCCRAIQEAISARDPDATVVIMRIAGRASIDTTLDADELVGVVAGAGHPATLAFSA